MNKSLTKFLTLSIATIGGCFAAGAHGQVPQNIQPRRNIAINTNQAQAQRQERAPINNQQAQQRQAMLERQQNNQPQQNINPAPRP